MTYLWFVRLLVLLLIALPASAASYFIELRESSRIRAEFSRTFRGTVAELTDEQVAELRKNPDVLAIHKDHPIHRFEPVATATPTALIDARARVRASNLPARGNGIVVAVIDSGVDATHPALNVAGGYDFAQNDPIPEDIEGHGTHVAGIIAANHADIVGVAPDVTLLAYKVVHVNGTGMESSLVAALERAIVENVDVVNISLGWDAGPDSIGSRAVDAATAAGIVVVVSAGNERRTPAQVKAPGVAESAITVANALTETEVVLESSRGPTPGTLAFKPDLAAPGENIVSTFLNGGMATLSGTSMSSPHVAGVAALLRELHPSWTPADVKAALISTTRAMNGTSLARGTGFVDAQAAHEARFFLDRSGLSFGINGAKTGTFDATRTFTITNRSQTSATFNAAAEPSITITPSTFTLAPNETRSVSARLIANNAELAFPSDSLIGGTIRLQSNTATLRVPWGLVRTARATFTYDGAIATLFATSPTRSRVPYQYSSNAAEMYAPPGEKWDMLLISADARVHVAEQVSVDNDEYLTINAADANRLFTLDARDAFGTPLHTLPNHKTTLRLTIDGSSLGGDTLNLGDVHELRITPHSSRFHFAPIETQLDASHAYGVMHPELTGDGATLTETLYQHTRLRWPAKRNVRASAHAAYGTSTILLDSIETSTTVDVYLTQRTSAGAFAALSFDSEHESLSLLRATNEGIAHGTHIAANGSEILLGRGPAHPVGLTEYRGEFGETRIADKQWQLFDANGALVAHGTTETPQPQPRYRYLATNAALRSELEIVFGTHLNPPAITSLRLLNDQTLQLIATTDQTRVWYRTQGTSTWNETFPTMRGVVDLRIELEDDAGSRVTWTQLGAFAVGDLSRRRAARH